MNDFFFRVKTIIQQNQGVTLVETMIAMFIFCLLVTPLLGMFYAGVMVYMSSGEDTVATGLAQARLEKYIDMSYRQLCSQKGLHGPKYCPEADNYYYVSRIKEHDFLKDVLKIEVEVYPAGKPEQGITVTSLKARR